MINFKDFLEENSDVAENIVCQKTVEGSSSDAHYVCCPPDLSPCSCECHKEVIRLENFGEWAFQESIKDYESTFYDLTKKIWAEWQINDFKKSHKGKEPSFSDIAHYELMYDFEDRLVLLDIAIACFGEKEIKRRLSERHKSNEKELTKDE